MAILSVLYNRYKDVAKEIRFQSLRVISSDMTLDLDIIKKWFAFCWVKSSGELAVSAVSGRQAMTDDT